MYHAKVTNIHACFTLAPRKYRASIAHKLRKTRMNHVKTKFWAAQNENHVKHAWIAYSTHIHGWNTNAPRKLRMYHACITNTPRKTRISYVEHSWSMRRLSVSRPLVLLVDLKFCYGIVIDWCCFTKFIVLWFELAWARFCWSYFVVMLLIVEDVSRRCMHLVDSCTILMSNTCKICVRRITNLWNDT